MADEVHSRFLQLQMAHERALFSYLVAAVQDYQEAEDLLQEITLVLWKKFDHYRPSVSYAAWAFGVARTELACYFRDRGRRGNLLSLEVLQRIEKAWVEEEERLEGERRALAACVEKLSEDHRQLFSFRYDKGFSLETLARKLGQTASAINMKLVRIRKALLDCTGRALVKEV